MNERLRELRVKCGYTQVQLAKILNIDRSTYSYYEIGKTTPNISVLVTLAKVFNIPINALLSDEGTPKIVSDCGVQPNFKKCKKNTSHIYELSDQEKMIIGVFRASSQIDKDKIVEYIQNSITKK